MHLACYPLDIKITENAELNTYKELWQIAK